MNRIIQLLALIVASVSFTFSATFTVTQLDGNEDWSVKTGSFLKAIKDANAAGVGPHTIVFNLPVGSTVTSTSPMLLTASNVTIDALAKNITLKLSTWGAGLTMAGQGNVLSNISVNGTFDVKGTDNVVDKVNFTMTGIEDAVRVLGATRAVIKNSVISKTGGSSNRFGVNIAQGSNGTIIEGNTISGFHNGVFLGEEFGGSAVANSNTTIKSNIISNVSNHGIMVRNTAGGNVIIDGNTVSKTVAAVVYISSVGVGTGIQIINNDLSQSTTSSGLYVESTNDVLVKNNKLYSNSGSGLTVDKALRTNVVSNEMYSNLNHGIVVLAGSNSKFFNNYVGTDKLQSAGKGNNWDGIMIENGTGYVIGKIDSGNVVVDNGNSGVLKDPRGAGVRMDGVTNSTIQSNFIGTNKLGTATNLGNDLNGIYLSAGTSGVTIGGTTTGLGNVIGKNGAGHLTISEAIGGGPKSGIQTETNVSAITITGNFIGTNGSGSKIGNHFEGISLVNTTASFIFNNIITNNLSGGGIALRLGSNNNKVYGNLIGTDLLGNTLGNGNYGVGIEGSLNNTIGGATAAEGNVIVAGTGVGIKLVKDWQGISSNGNTIINNRIGNVLGNDPTKDNKGVGIAISQGSSNNKIGLVGQGNVISNIQGGFSAIKVFETGSIGNTIKGNTTSCNTGLGIELTTGGNNEYGKGLLTINWGAFASATVLAGKAPTLGAIIDVYIADTACHTTCRATGTAVTPQANAQGMTWVGQTTAVSDGKGGIVWSYTIPGGSKLSWNNAIVTATHPTNGNTSQFSICEFDAPCTAPTSVVLTAADSSLCAGQFPATITSTTNVSNYRYTWLKGTQVVSSGLNLTTLSITTAGTYTLRVADPLDTNSCKLTSAAIVITENTPPSTLNFSVKADSICFGNKAVSFTVAPATAGSAYQWKIGTAIAAGKTKASESLDLSAVAAGTSVTISVTETTNAGCVGTVVSTPVKVNPLPGTITVGQEDTICKGAKVTYTATPQTQGSTYQWTIPLGGTIEVGQTTNEVRVDFASATAGKANVTVVETNKFGCVATTPAALPIEVFDNPVLPSVTGNFTPTCESSGNTYKITNYIAANTYVWTVPSGSTITTQKADSIVVTFGNISGTVTLKATSPAGCESTLQSQAITLQSCNLKAAFEIVPDSVCIGEDVVVVNNSTGDILSWTWDFDTAAVNSATPATFNGASPGAITYATAGTKFISLSVNDGVNTRDTILSVVVSPLPTPVTIDGATAVCAEAKGAVYSVVHEANNTYLWSVTGADVISESAIKDSIFVNIGATTPASVSVIKTNEFGCAFTTSSNVTVNTNPVTPTIAPIELCEGTTNHVVSVAAANYTYNWTVDAATGTITSGQGTNEIILDVLDASGSIQLEVIDNATSCKDVNGVSTTTITVNPLPKNFTLTPTDERCTEAKAVVYTVDGGLPNSTYTWTYPTSVTVVDDNSASISVDFGTTKETIEISVKETSSKGCTSILSATLSVELKGAPTPLTIEGADIGCNTKTDVFSVAPSPGSIYNWNVIPSDGAQIISGNGTSSIEVLFTDVDVTLSVSESNSAGCSSPTPDTKVLTIPKALGEITLSGGSLNVCDIRDKERSPAKISFSAANSTGYFLPISNVIPAEAARLTQVGQNIFSLAVDTLNGKAVFSSFDIVIEAQSECETRQDTFPITVEDAKVLNITLGDNLLCLGNNSSFAPSTGIANLTALYAWTLNGEQLEDTTSFLNLITPTKDDTVSVKYVSSPSVCVDYDKSTLEATAYSVVVSRPGALASAVDLQTMERPRYEVNKTSIAQGSYFSSEDVLELVKIEDVYALQEKFNRNTPDFVFPKNKTENNFYYNWEWKIYGAHDSTYSDTGIVNYNNSVALPAVIGRPEKITYRVSVYNGVCTDYDSVDVLFAYRPWPPNAFSPNNDGFFDKWEIRNVDKYPGTEVKIFNRWGVELLTIPNYDREENWWDGTKDGNPLPTGTYFYWVDFKDGGDPVTGSVSLIK